MQSLRKDKEFDNHSFVIFICDPKIDLEGYICIHRVKSAGSSFAPSFGATRLYEYKNNLDSLRDALKLSRMMSYKAAMAGLPCGGAKATIVNKGFSPQQKRTLLKTYAQKISQMAGIFITGSDVGVSAADVAMMKKESPYFVGINVNPEYHTGYGLWCSMQAGIDHVFGRGNLKGRRYAVQGVGKVGEELIKLISPTAELIYISDINKERLRYIRRKYPKIEIVGNRQILSCNVDIFSPCAMGGVINKESVKELRCKMVIGGANNQLRDINDGELLHKKGILYVPDYIANSGGLISVYSEYENESITKESINKKVKRIYKTVQDVIKESVKKGISVSGVANQIAEKIVNK